MGGREKKRRQCILFEKESAREKRESESESESERARARARARERESERGREGARESETDRQRERERERERQSPPETAIKRFSVSVCFITAGPITKLCAWGEEESGGHVL